MADPNAGQVAAMAWEAVVGKKPQDNIFGQFKLIAELQKKAKSLDGGRVVNGPIEYGVNTTVTSYDDLEPIGTNRVDVFDEFTASWKQYAGTVVMSHFERARNQGSGKKFGLLPAKMENLRNSFLRTMNTDLFASGTGNSSKAIMGILGLIPLDPTTGTVEGINRATFTFWRSKQTSGAKTTTAFDNLKASMRSIYNQVSVGYSQKHPDFAVTDRASFEGYESLSVTLERLVRESKMDYLDSGFDNEKIRFKGLGLCYDDAQTAGYMHIFNTEHFYLVYPKGYWMKGLPSVEPSNQTAEVFRVMCIAQLVTDNSRHGGVITGIT